MITIAAVDADWLLDSRATPTVEVTVTLTDGSRHRAMAPAGASTGSHESAELRDHGDPRWRGRGVQAAVTAARQIASPALAGLDPGDQTGLDARLIEADGTQRRDRLGANTMVAASVACARAGAAVAGRELWQHLGQGRHPLLPVPMVNIVSGNLHAAGGMGIQDILVIPAGAPTVAAALEWVHDVYHATGDLLRERGAATLVGDEGGYGSPVAASGDSSGEAIALVTEAIARTGRGAPADVGIALDVAATHLARGAGRYELDGRPYTRDELTDLVAGWAGRFPLLSVEDPFDEDDWAPWQALARRCPGLQLIGDDLIATHLDRLQRAARDGAASAVLTKINQIGTVTEALAVADEAAALGLRAVISARSGETEDDWLADLAVASGAGQIKVGSVARSERLAKYNRLLRIERSPDFAALPALGWAATVQREKSGAKLMAGTSKDQRTGPYEQIYRRIIEGVYRPGERLIEQRIAEELAVSRTPVREALVRLEGAGLVVNARHKGAMVRSLTRKDIVDLYELRAVLESLAAKRAASRADEDEMTRMAEAIVSFDEAITQAWPMTIDQLRALNTANRQFHETVLTAARHPLLGQLLSVTVDAPLVFQAFRRFDQSESERSNLFHRLIRNAIAAGDGERAARLMTEHIDEGRDVLLDGFDRVGSVEGLFENEPGVPAL